MRYCSEGMWKLRGSCPPTHLEAALDEVHPAKAARRQGFRNRLGGAAAGAVHEEDGGAAAQALQGGQLQRGDLRRRRTMRWREARGRERRRQPGGASRAGSSGNVSINPACAPKLYHDTLCPRPPLETCVT